MNNNFIKVAVVVTMMASALSVQSADDTINSEREEARKFNEKMLKDYDRMLMRSPPIKTLRRISAKS